MSEMCQTATSNGHHNHGGSASILTNDVKAYRQLCPFHKQTSRGGPCNAPQFAGSHSPYEDLTATSGGEVFLDLVDRLFREILVNLGDDAILDVGMKHAA